MASYNMLVAQEAAITGIVGTGGPAHAGVLALFTNNPSITRNSQVADFTIPTFTGYAPVTSLVWTAPYIGPAGIVQASAPGGLFQRTGGTVDEVANGWFITDTGGTNVVAAGYFDAPVNFTADGDGVFLDALIRYGD